MGEQYIPPKRGFPASKYGDLVHVDPHSKPANPEQPGFRGALKSAVNGVEKMLSTPAPLSDAGEAKKANAVRYKPPKPSGP